MALAVAIFVPLAAHRLSLWRENRARLLIARANFRAAFSTDVAEVANPSRLPEIYVYLAQRFPAHRAAVLEFSAYLNSRARFRLTEDWSAYASGIDQIRQRYNALSGTAEAELRRKLAVERLEKVVSHGNAT